MRRSFPLAVGGPLLVTGVLSLAGCSADAKDFQEQGEKFLEGDEVRERFGMVRMSDAQCEEPANIDKDTLYTCTATGTDGNTWQFTLEITGSKSLRVIKGEVVAQGATAASEPTTPSPTTAAAPATTAAGATTAAPTTAATPTTTT